MLEQQLCKDTVNVPGAYSHDVTVQKDSVLVMRSGSRCYEYMVRDEKTWQDDCGDGSGDDADAPHSKYL